ncbi:sigma 54-interacting transcriptional regulator [Intestinimonas butyriciproducens]|uniref:sigma 54-interacting transcriptional regulator n=1 Tax=Intestinimonas butyriciproducens TaxID=1297617 RepID=UPI0034E410DE
MRKRLALIQQTVETLTEQFSLLADADHMKKYQITSIAEQLGILPNNASNDLNELFRTGQLMKIKGRPVYYLSLPKLEKKLHMTLRTNQADGLEHFFSLIQPDRASNPSATVHPCSGALDAVTSSEMDQLIGADKSLYLQIRQAKAAILYPPSGLHTLITGQTGTGKSSFARSMYDFAVKSGRLAPDAAFVTLNCANYADNPQLLLSQLFGHVRGAFTGADKDHVGLVEYADKGILFFDEIHRLSAEGQEKLFLLMDRGTYNRLGETGKERHAKVLILGATTEDPDKAMLSTFLRRIPVHITLPPLCERTIQERLELVLYFLWQESRTLKMRIAADRTLIFAFCYYSCAANIGQLSTDIKLTCANAHYDYLTGKNRNMLIQISHLDENVRQGLFTVSNSRNELLNPLFKPTGDGPITFDGGMSYEDILGLYINRSV